MIRKSMDLGFIVVNPERDISHLRTTNASISRHYYGSEIVHLLPKEADAQDMKESKQFVQNTWRGGENEIAMINTGFKKLKSEWGVIVRAGTILRHGMDIKFAQFMKDEKDIFFPIAVDSAHNFLDASLNGVAINTGFFKEVGPFPDNTMWKASEPDLPIFKLLWAGDALQKGCTFKAILGVYPR